MSLRESSVPFYEQVARTLRDRIKSGLYNSGQIIPPEKELEKEFGLSNITIRKALSLLVQDGFVVRRRGLGTVVAARPDARIAIEITGSFRDWLHSATGGAQQFESKVLEIVVTTCPEHVRRILNMDATSPVWRMKRLRCFQGEPLSYYVNYGRPELMRGITAPDVAKRSFIEVFQERSGLKITHMEQHVEARVADLDIADTLGLHFGDAIFYVELVYFTGRGARRRPVEVTYMYFRGDRYFYKATIPLHLRSKRGKS
ncbi:MAG: GntR family transcriptional regulator [Thermodesulfobacteriota bacterium]